MAKKRSGMWFPDTSSHFIAGLVESYLGGCSPDEITISERQFPFRVRADLQKAIDRMFTGEVEVAHFCGIRKQQSFHGLDLSDCLVSDDRDPAVSIPPQYEEIDVGEASPLRCLKNGLWLLDKSDESFAVLFAPVMNCGRITGVKFQIGTSNTPNGTRVREEFFRELADAVEQAETYRGKILSLEYSPHTYTGQSSGIMVHRLRTVSRDQVILPRETLELLERNVIRFVKHRSELMKFRLPTKKGLLFYGPPGTGKTHTIHYLASALKGHTTLLITSEQIGILGEYMTLARLLQPSIVVIEDVDLIAQDRRRLETGEEVLLNKLLNEMDGLREDADILFLLTTNRPETLEKALASRPGRIDQAIEFPLPDAEGRRKLVQLYSSGVALADDVVEATVRKTEKVSAAFIKELMRRSVQFNLERENASAVGLEDIDNALSEMLLRGGSLNLKLLGAEQATLNS